jgi:hypothetical protein
MAENESYLHVRQGRQLSLGLRSLIHLEKRLGLPCSFLLEVSLQAGGCYKKFYSRPRLKPFQKLIKPAKLRTIDNPSSVLKFIQRQINRKLLQNLNLPFYLCGGVRGRSVLDNVWMHFGARQVVAVDIRNFFPCISNFQVYDVWQKLLGCSPEIASLLTKLTTVERRLPQGAPTSTLLANLVLHMSDVKIRNVCEERGITYSTWVDDLAFSGINVPQILEVVIPELHRSGFLVSRKKLRIMGPGDQKVLNGIVMGKFPGLLKSRFSQIRSGVHKIQTNQVPAHELENYVRRLKGRILHVRNISQRKGDILLRELQSAREGQTF